MRKEATQILLVALAGLGLIIGSVVFLMTSHSADPGSAGGILGRSIFMLLIGCSTLVSAIRMATRLRARETFRRMVESEIVLRQDKAVGQEGSGSDGTMS